MKSEYQDEILILNSIQLHENKDFLIDFVMLYAKVANFSENSAFYCISGSCWQLLEKVLWKKQISGANGK